MALSSDMIQQFDSERDLFAIFFVTAKTKEKGAATSCNPLYSLAPRPGLEPGTYGLTVRRSTD